MPTSDPVEIMLSHNQWAMHRMLDACEGLSDEQLDRPFEMGVGTLRATLTHILGAMMGWGHLLAGRQRGERLEDGGPYTVAQLRQLTDELAADIAASAKAHALAEGVSGERQGRSYTFTRGAVITHVMTHGMHHRAQCLNMLRQMGIETLPPSAVVEWMIMEDGQG